ncbi:hypothetical protein [Synechococcus sp. A18-25c]|nr:hypothetical protein [Synechococcus sp. A18-25c]
MSESVRAAILHGGADRWWVFGALQGHSGAGVLIGPISKVNDGFFPAAG